MDWSDLAGILRDAKNVTININAGDGEMYTGPVQVNQMADAPAVDSARDDYAPRCLYCGWDTSPLVRDDMGLYYHSRCKSDADRISDRWTPEPAPDPVHVRVMPWQVVHSEPDIPPEPEPVVLQIAAPRVKTYFEEI